MTERCGESNPLKLVVGIATVGRPQILNETLRELRKQERQPDRTLIGHCTDNDIAGLRVDNGQIGYVRAPLGLTSQRNAILNAARGFDIVVFFDDDFFPSPQYLKMIEKAFQLHPDYQMITGTLLADGIGGRGIEPTIARSIIQNDLGTSTPLRAWKVYNGYGCNMSIDWRMS